MCLGVAVAGMKYHDQKPPGEETHSATEQFTNKSSEGRNSNRAGNCRQERMQRPWKGAADWLAPHSLLSLLSYLTQAHGSRGGTITTTNFKKKCPKLYLMEAFSQLGLPPFRRVSQL